MARLVRLALAVAALAAAGSSAPAQQRPTAPVAYLVYSTQRDGKDFPDGNAVRLRGVTRSYPTRTQWVDEINSVHRYQAGVMELYSEKDYSAAVQLVQNGLKPGQIKRSTPSTPAPRPAAVPSVANTVWDARNSGYLWVYPDGTWEMGDRRRINSNDRGTWTQTGDRVTFRGPMRGEYVVSDRTLREATIGLRSFGRIE